MANYLMPATGQSVIQAPAAGSKDSFIHVDDMYKIRIYNTAKTIQFTGYIPPDFSFSLASNWNAPFGDTSLGQMAQGLSGVNATSSNRYINAAQRGAQAIGNSAGAAEKALKFGGATSMFKVASAKLWTQPSYLQLDLPIFLDAYSDTKTEIVENLVKLLSLCAPTEALGGLLIAPGPSPVKQAANEAQTQYNNATGNSNGDTAASFDDPEAFTVDIGNFFTMKPAVVDSVSVNFDNVFEDVSGNPIRADFVLQVSSYFAVTRQDLQKWLKVSQTSISGA